VLNRQRRALQIVGCRETPVVAHLPVSDVQVARLAESLGSR
jgi:hypothetical protein